MEYIQRHRRAVAIVLMFCLVLVNVYSFQGRAHAFVISGTVALGVALCAFILVAAGLVLANSDAADTAATAFYEDETEMIDSLLADGKVIYRPHEEEAEQFKFVAGIGEAAWQTVVDWVHANYVSGANTSGSEWSNQVLIDKTYTTSDPGYVSPSSFMSYVPSFYQNMLSDPHWDEYHFVVCGLHYDAGSDEYYHYIARTKQTSCVVSGDQLTVPGIWYVYYYHGPAGNLTQYWAGGADDSMIDLSDYEMECFYNVGTVSAIDSGIYANPDRYASPLTGAHDVSVPLEATTLNPDLELDSGIGLKAGTPGAAVGLEEPAVLDLPLTGVEELPSTVVDNPADAVEDVTTADDAMAADETETSLRGLLLTKFPFCIPWDIANAFKLLVAPPEAPYFEVDFLEPLDIEWQGSTTIVFDMAEYPMIGQVSRWVFTVEFCIVLAVGTRKIIRA